MCWECHNAFSASFRLPEGSCLLPAWQESHAILSCVAEEAKDLQGILASPAPLRLPVPELSLMITGPRIKPKVWCAGYIKFSYMECLLNALCIHLSELATPF